MLTTALRTANELGLTRVDLPFLVGTAFSADRARAKALGYVAHLVAGQVFALVYYAIFLAIDTNGWLLGALFGLLHGIVSATALVNGLLPIVHPRIGSTLTAADGSPLLEPPGFLMRNTAVAPRSPPCSHTSPTARSSAASPHSPTDRCPRQPQP